MFSRYTLTGRRKKARRRSEAVNYYVDRYEWRHLIIIALIMIFCILDYWLSLKIFQWGGSELNLFMSDLVKSKRVLLVFVKLGITLIGLVFLLFHKNFKVFGVLKTHVVFYYIFSLYLALVVYEFYAFQAIRRASALP